MEHNSNFRKASMEGNSTLAGPMNNEQSHQQVNITPHSGIKSRPNLSQEEAHDAASTSPRIDKVDIYLHSSIITGILTSGIEFGMFALSWLPIPDSRLGTSECPPGYNPKHLTTGVPKCGDPVGRRYTGTYNKRLLYW